jgi:hypothetical protein
MSGVLSRIALVTFFGAVLQGRAGDRLRYVVHAPAGLAPGLRLAVDDLRADVARVTGQPVAVRGLPDDGDGCRAGEVHLVVRGQAPELAAQEYHIDEQRCRRGRRVVMAGGSLLASQWAVYDLLQRLGVRYFHPEASYYPSQLSWPAAPLAVRARPAFQRRSMHVHRDHPVELSAPLAPAGLPLAAFQRRWIDWNVKLRQTLVDGWDAELVGRYAYERGFPRTASLNLANAQQGGRPVLNPDDPAGEQRQIERAIDEALAPRPGLPDPSLLTFQFNPSEWSEADEDVTVARLELVTRTVARRYPQVALYTINHGTSQPPTRKRGVRFFDLSAFAPPTLGVMVHPLMFYDLDRPAAGVYGNASFANLLGFALEQQRRRPIVHYPEGSWWLTFDQPVPLYLAPVTLEARQRDLERLYPHRSTDPGQGHGVMGHHLFTSGQEWGYWLIDYCVARMAWDPAFGHGACLDDFTAQLARGEEIRAVLRAVEARQAADLRDPELLRFLVGSDDDVEAAAGLNIPFHPLPPAPAELLEWDEAQVTALEARSLAPLAAMAADYHRFADRIERVLPAQAAAQAPWVREIRDGLRVFALRAAHAAAVYEGALLARATRTGAGGGASARAPLSRALSRARALTEAARQVVRRREADYRYPAALTIAGGERGTAQAQRNRTGYPYRYLSRTHRMFYWTRPDEQLAALVRRVLAAAGQPVAAAGAGDRRLVFPRGSLRVESPRQAQRLEGLLPGLNAVLGDDGAPYLELAAVGAGAGGGDAEPAPWRGERQGGRSGPADLPLALRRLGELVIREALVEVDAPPGAAPRPPRLRISGRLRTDDIIALMVKTGGFEATGARTVLALTLGFTPGGLPEAVPVALHAEGR